MISDEAVPHVAYSDESHWNVGRYRAVAMVSLPSSRHDEIHSEASKLLVESSLREFKWKDFRGARERHGASKLSLLALEHARCGSLRIDAVCWDTEDERHRIPGRDDVANLQRMYFHLLRVVLRDRWPDSAIWEIRPDERNDLDWSSIEDFVRRAGLVPVRRDDIFAKDGVGGALRNAFRITGIAPKHSEHNPLIQLADLFAGLCCFSRNKYDGFLSWRGKRDAAESLFPDIGPGGEESRAERERYVLLDEFNARCKQRKLGVSLATHRGLRTPQPKNPINFWWYEPQHEWDKAPVRGESRKDR